MVHNSDIPGMIINKDEKNISTQNGLNQGVNNFGKKKFNIFLDKVLQEEKRGVSLHPHLRNMRGVLEKIESRF